MSPGTIELMQHIVFYGDAANVLVGIPYALFGRANLSCDGNESPRWLGFTTRLVFPFLVIGTVLLTDGLAGLRANRENTGGVI